MIYTLLFEYSIMKFEISVGSINDLPLFDSLKIDFNFKKSDPLLISF